MSQPPGFIYQEKPLVYKLKKEIFKLKKAP